MKKTFAISLAQILLGLTYAVAQEPDLPKIQVDQMVYDFGKTSQVASVSGIFKLKNIGGGLLKVQPPMPSCGCTVAALNPDSLPPGATGELSFTMNLGTSRAVLEKHIVVRSNDPLAPEISLIIKVDYTPLYELNPAVLQPTLAFGVNEIEQSVTLARTDGKPVGPVRLDPSKPWITAKVEPAARPEDPTVRISIAIQRDGPPRRFNESIYLYAGEQTNSPISTIPLSGEFNGEVSVSPQALYWSLGATGTTSPVPPEAAPLRRMTITSADGQALKLKNPQSSIKGLNVELVPKEDGKVYELVARLDDPPTNTISGNVSFETSVAAQPRIEVPVIVNVFTP